MRSMSEFTEEEVGPSDGEALRSGAADCPRSPPSPPKDEGLRGGAPPERLQQTHGQLQRCRGLSLIVFFVELNQAR